MKNTLLVIAVSMLCLASFAAVGGERVVCKIWLDDGGVVARSTAPDVNATTIAGAGLARTTLDGFACPAIRLQVDGGILSKDGGFDITSDGADGGWLATDGGAAGCPFCDFRGANSVVMQCKDPVYYSEKWDGGVDRWNQRGVVPATTDDVLVDFDINPDGYRIDFRDSTNANKHISVKPVSGSSSNTCTFSTIMRRDP